MGILAAFGLAKNVGASLASPIDAIAKGLDGLFTSDDERAQNDAVMERIRQNPSIMQIELNKVEAQHRSVFVAGWRPFIGWICGTSLGLYYIPQFIMATIIWTRLCWSATEILPYPITEINGLTQLIYGLLGLGTLRTLEKVLGKAK